MKTEEKNARREKFLGDIMEEARAAIDIGAGMSEEYKDKLYSEALRRISAKHRELIGEECPCETVVGSGAFFMPKSVIAGIVNMKKTCVSLPDLWMERVERFGIVYGVHVRKNPFAKGFEYSIFQNFKLVASGSCQFGKEKCRLMAMGALKALMHKSERRLRRSARKTVLANPPFSSSVEGGEK